MDIRFVLCRCSLPPARTSADSCRCVADLRKFFGAPSGAAPRAAPKAEAAPPASVVRCCQNACRARFAGKHGLTPADPQPEVVDLVDADDEPQQVAATPAKRVKQEPGAASLSDRRRCFSACSSLTVAATRFA